MVEPSTEDNNVLDTPANPNATAPPQNTFWSVLKGFLFRAMIVYFVTSYFRKPATQPTNPDGTVPMEGPRKTSSNMFPNGTNLDFFFYLSENEMSVDFNDENLIWSIPDFVYGDWYGGPNGDSTYTLNTQIPASKHVQNNGSLWGHIFVVRSGFSPNPALLGRYAKNEMIHKYKCLNRYKKKKYLKTSNLLTGETTASAQVIEKSIGDNPIEILSHWHPNLTINIIDDHTPWIQGHVPPPIDEYVDFDLKSGKYYPIVYINDYWNLIRDYTPINETVEFLPMYLTFHPLSLFRWQLYTAQAMRARWTSFMGQDLMPESEEEQDSLKETLLETSPYLLGITFVISLVHSVFEFLAFKNDIQFWKNRQSLEGISVRSVFFNVFQSLIVLLYILDNDTNLMVRLSVFVGLLIELWKIHKVSNISIDRENKFFGIIPRINISNKDTYVQSATKEYDILAFRYLSWALYPLLGIYAIYSLLYLEHKGWYSWVLGMLYGFLLTFGFIMMTPQLFINYKLKSVAHLPWRMLTYKFLNTFIDDIFAFVIKMPTMYRLGCFRDDIIFLIFLFQRYIYRVDLKRVNEFGTSGEMDGRTEPNESLNGEAIANKKDD